MTQEEIKVEIERVYDKETETLAVYHNLKKRRQLLLSIQYNMKECERLLQELEKDPC